MSKIALIVTMEITSGDIERLLSITTAHKARSLAEPGTVQFEILRPSEDNARLLTCEVYRDDAALEQHKNGSSLAQWREESAGLIKNFHVTRCAIVD